jgi:hypothetical protein
MRGAWVSAFILAASSLAPLLLLGCAGPTPSAPPMERVRVAPDGKGFRLAVSGRPFTPWGFNYDHDEKGRLLEDYRESESAKVEEDFREMRELGATTVRIHLQVSRFLEAPDLGNASSLARLGRLLGLAETLGLHLDVTGLGCCRKSDTPAWYENADEKSRWAAQAKFWDVVSAACAKSPAVLCYNLMNEPISPSGPGKVWHGGQPLGGFYYVESLSLDPGKRTRPELTREWMRTLIPSIRKNDPSRLITCGMFFLFEVPAGLTLTPDPRSLAEDLDYFSVHLYPKDASVDSNLELLTTLRVGKPIVIEETFPLGCSMPSFRRFFLGTRETVSGWIGFYWGRPSRSAAGPRTCTTPSSASGWSFSSPKAPSSRPGRIEGILVPPHPFPEAAFHLRTL